MGLADDAEDEQPIFASERLGIAEPAAPSVSVAWKRRYATRLLRLRGWVLHQVCRRFLPSPEAALVHLRSCEETDVSQAMDIW